MIIKVEVLCPVFPSVYTQQMEGNVYEIVDKAGSNFMSPKDYRIKNIFMFQKLYCIFLYCLMGNY